MINFTIFLVLITIVSFLLVMAVMVQNPKGGGLSSAIGGPQIMGGVQKTTDFLDKSTWTLAAILVALIIFSSLSFGSGASTDSLTDESAVPTTPAPAATAPAQNGAAAPAGTAQPAAPAAQPQN
ncbi:MAG: preprotein translocase subunit SecG [Bacteroidia bacterium]